MEQLIETWRRLDMRRRVVLAGATLLTAVAVLGLAQFAARPSMALLYSGLDPAAAGEVVGALEQMNVASDVRGDAIYVAEDARDRVRLALAREGLPRQGQAGYELLDRISGFSATADMFDAAYLRAREGELARTILASPGVRAARVHIAAPGRSPFARDQARPTASATVTMSSGVLGEAQATAIRYLVALAVAGLPPEQVAVIDSRAGVVLAPGAETPAASVTGEAAEREARLKAEIEQLVFARVGRDRARVSVTVDTEREAETVVEKTIRPESRVAIHTDNEEIADTSSGADAAVTVASNLPDGDAGPGERRSASRTETRERANYDYSQVERQTVRQAGAVRRISVAVLVDGITREGPDGTTAWEPRPETELAALRSLVTAAIGFDESRGDVVTVQNLAFEPDAVAGATAESGFWQRLVERNAMTFIQIAVLAAVSLLLGLKVVRPILTRPVVTTYRPAPTAGEAAAIDSGRSGPSPAALPSPEAPATAGDEARPGLSESEALRLAIASQPERGVALLREWLAADEAA